MRNVAVHPLAPRRIMTRSPVSRHLGQQRRVVAALLSQAAFFVQGHLSHLQSAFLASAVHPHASHLHAAFFSALAGHCANAVAPIIAAAAISVIIMFFMVFSFRIPPDVRQSEVLSLRLI